MSSGKLVLLGVGTVLVAALVYQTLWIRDLREFTEHYYNSQGY